MGELAIFLQNYPTIRDFNSEMNNIITSSKGKCSISHIFEKLEINNQFLIDLYNDLPCFEESKKICGNKLENIIHFSKLSLSPEISNLIKKVIREIYFELIKLAKLEEESFLQEHKKSNKEEHSENMVEDELTKKYSNLLVEADTVDVGDRISLPKSLIKALIPYLNISDFDSIVYGISKLKLEYKKYLLEEWDVVGKEFFPLYKSIRISSSDYDDYDDYFDDVNRISKEKISKQTNLFRIFSCISVEAKKLYLVKKLPLVFSLSDEKLKKLLKDLSEEEQNEVYGLLLDISMLDNSEEEKIEYSKKIPFVVKKRILELQK